MAFDFFAIRRVGEVNLLAVIADKRRVVAQFLYGFLHRPIRTAAG